ncbi:hypothetical protein JG687_00013995 [Phytophthora cactorum]|uniref:Uncharacterized protein n=1 Tax=Phytophthora cactorum TaxID=29920 RepID=A0A8T1TXD2_9STRA|nr:hypothetical protein JG687_00013995 [Phytophthora cactorum]
MYSAHSIWYWGPFFHQRGSQRRECCCRDPRSRHTLRAFNSRSQSIGARESLSARRRSGLQTDSASHLLRKRPIDERFARTR